MKRLILLAVLFAFASCNKKGKDVLAEKDKALDIPELVGYLGKSYVSVEKNFNNFNPKITGGLGERTVEVSVKDKNAPITTYTLRLIENKASITKIVIENNLAGHEKNKQNLRYFDDKLSFPLVARLPIDNMRNPEYSWAGSKDEFYTYLRNNTDFGGWIQYDKVNILTGSKSSPFFGIVIGVFN